MDKTLLKGLHVLETVSRLDGANYTLDQLAEELGLSRSNTHRTLQTLSHAGYVRRDPETGAYQCTLKMFELGSRRLEGMDVRHIAPPHMRELSRSTSETVHLCILDGIEVVYIDRVDSPQPLIAYSPIGGRAPAYAVSAGKALLAFQGPDYIGHYAKSIKKHTDRTHTSVPAIRRELDEVASAGYAVNRGEWRPGIGCVAAPIFNGLGRVVAALGISGPLERLDPARMAELAQPLQSAARQVSGLLGHRGGYPGTPKNGASTRA